VTLALVSTLVLAAGIGVSLGLLGGGGSILAVPLLVYVAGLPPKEAIATSLLVVGATSAVALVPHARVGRVRWRTGLLFGLAGMAGAYAGGRLSAYVPAGVLLAGFAVMMLATAAAMIRGRTVTGGPVPRELPVLRVVADGLVVGLVTGLVGAGGGFLVVPALALLGRLAMPVAVGTSLLVIAMKSLAGLAGYLSTIDINWMLAGAVTAVAIGGSLLGGRLAGRVREDQLRKTFGWFVAVMGLFVLAQQLPAGGRTDPRLWIVAGTLVVGVAVIAVVRGRKRRRSTPPDGGESAERPAGTPSGQAGRSR
jgi:uncharacterized membrane protein YfcA